jgi:hypothetical protein
LPNQTNFPNVADSFVSNLEGRQFQDVRTRLRYINVANIVPAEILEMGRLVDLKIDIVHLPLSGSRAAEFGAYQTTALPCPATC